MARLSVTKQRLRPITMRFLSMDAELFGAIRFMEVTSMP